MLSIPGLLAILCVLFLFSAFFSATEAALIAVNKVRLRHLVENKKRGARRVYGLVSRMDKLIATLLVGNNLANTAIAAISTYLCTLWFGPGKGLIVVTLFITILLVIFAELTPKIFATNHPMAVSFLGRHVISFLIFVFSPITRLLTAVSNGVIRLLGGNPHHRSPLVTEEEIKMMIQIGKEEGFYGDNERKMLERIFHFDEIELRDVMTPLDRMVAVPVDIAAEELEKVLLEEGHNRIPVYEREVSNIVGIIYVRDLLYLYRNNSLIRLNDLMNAPFFVSPFQKVAELLKEFQKRKIQIAIVKDPKTQKAVGLVTLEDLMEEIVGEIEEAGSRDHSL
ncbi:MAG: HlyC/CorC family transporter [Candidatus Omnitrophica bacterium]|nr:HlyC/CorC family transporter [Candidatus Omnitrophota bacterium]